MSACKTTDNMATNWIQVNISFTVIKFHYPLHVTSLMQAAVWVFFHIEMSCLCVHVTKNIALYMLEFYLHPSSAESLETVLFLYPGSCMMILQAIISWASWFLHLRNTFFSDIMISGATTRHRLPKYTVQYAL